MDYNGSEAEALFGRYVALRDPRDFEAIVAHFAGMVIGVARRRTGDHGSAEEVAQNVLGEQPQSPLRDMAVSKFANRLFVLDPERALDWANSIGDSQMRERGVNRLLRKWRENDANAAEAWEGAR